MWNAMCWASLLLRRTHPRAILQGHAGQQGKYGSQGLALMSSLIETLGGADSLEEGKAFLPSTPLPHSAMLLLYPGGQTRLRTWGADQTTWGGDYYYWGAD